MIPLDIIAEQESRAAVGRGRMTVKRHAHRVRQHRLERDRVQTKLQNLEASNPFLSQGDLSRTTTSWLFLVYVIAAFGVDFALSGAVIQELTNSGDQLLWRTVLTLMLVIAECTVSIRRYLARRQCVSLLRRPRQVCRPHDDRRCRLREDDDPLRGIALLVPVF